MSVSLIFAAALLAASAPPAFEVSRAAESAAFSVSRAARPGPVFEVFRAAPTAAMPERSTGADAGPARTISAPVVRPQRWNPYAEPRRSPRTGRPILGGRLFRGGLIRGGNC